MKHLVLGALALSACSHDLDLPPVPEAAPRVDRMTPGVAIASLGTRVRLWGELPPGTRVFLGPAEVPPERIVHGEGGELVLEIDDAFTRTHQDAMATTLEGRSLQVRIATDAGEATAPGLLRIFSGRSRVDSIEPRDLAPGKLMLIRGTGFDPEVVENNEVSLVGRDPATGEPDCRPTSRPGERPACARASVLVATSSQVVALVPAEIPAGEVQIVYRNLAYVALEQALEEATRGGHDAAYVFSRWHDGGCDGCSEGGEEPAEIPTHSDGHVGQGHLSWDDPGLLAIEGEEGIEQDPHRRAGGEIRLVATGRIAYPAAGAGLAPDLQVLLDGVPVVPLAGVPGEEGEAVDPTRLVFTVPEWVIPGYHAVQVINPLHRSSIARVLIK